ncbi:MAG: mechanosensitive ion channel family protein [Pyrinomonadaceae bacterium]
METPGQIVNDPTVSRLIVAILGLFVVILVAKLVKGSITRYVKTVDTRYKLRKFVSFLSYIVIVLLLTIVFSDRLGNLTVAMGVAGAGVAFALQEVIASFAGWFAIIFAGFYKTGDRVQLGGIKGDVIDVSFLRTTLMEVGEWVSADLYSGRVVRVANSFVFKEPVFNYSGEFPFLWDEITVPIKYGSDHNLARRILEDVSRKAVTGYSKDAHRAWIEFSKQFLLENATVEPIVTLALNDNWMEFTLRYVVDFKARRRTKDTLFNQILDEFEKTDGKVGIASTTMHIVETPPLSVRISGESSENSRNRS